MPQSLNQKAVNNFVKGLVTEAAELTFPEGASVDELNCDLRRDGTRRRRLAVAYEANNTLSSFTLGNTEKLSSGDWINVGGNSELEFLVVQKGTTLYFYNKTNLPHSGQVISGTINLTSHEYAGSAGAETERCQFTTIKGDLVVSSPAIDTIVVEYNSSTGAVSASEISFKVRDFLYQGDVGDYFTQSPTTSPSDARIYDTLNSGWAEENNGHASENALERYKIDRSNKYPPLTHSWFTGKDSSELQKTDEFEKIAAGTSLSGNGRYILDFFDKDRSTAISGSGETIGTGLDETETSRFRCVEAFAGRVFYAGLDSEANTGTILFTGLVEGVNDLGKCYQINDPTSEHFSDLLGTDGGEVKIPDAVNIRKLYAYQYALFVFADNGVWQLTGSDGQFRADSYTINRVSRVGILSEGSFVAAEGLPFWWSRFGIHTLQTDSVSGQGAEKNLSISTIQGFWDEIDSDAKANVVSIYDNISKRIYWGYPDENETVENKLNNFLLLDIPLMAFFPWRIEDQASSTDAVVGLAFYAGVSTFDTGDPAIVLLCRDGATNKLTMGGFSEKSFLDWGDANYSSYAVTGYDFMGDLSLKKNAPYVLTYNRLTETGFTGNEASGYEAVRPSSMLVSAAWDFKETFSSTQQAYRLKYPVVVNPNDLTEYNYPEDVITSRLKLRGHGRSVRIKFESEQGKDFLLLGWGMISGANPRF